MKKLLALWLAVILLLTVTACGGTAAPADTTPAATEAAPAETAAPAATEEPAPAELLSVTGAADCMNMLTALGYPEVNPELYPMRVEKFGGIAGASATPAAMEVTGDSFRMELDTVEYFHEAGELRETDGWVLYGTQSDGLKVIPDLEGQGYVLFDESVLSDGSGSIYQMTDYTYYKLNEQGSAEAMAYVTAAYYPQTGNLYNVVQEFFEAPEGNATALIFAETIGDYRGANEVETIQWGEFTVELHPFVIECGAQQFVYKYRPGMSLSDWACSELNTDGWIPWYDDMVLSPDRKYITGTGYLAMENLYGDPILTMSAQEFDGKLDHTYLYSFELMGSVENADEAMAYLKSEEAEIASSGNINVAVAHMVNARTPLFTPGFRTVGKEEGRAAYHSVEIGSGLFLLDDIIDVYMNGIDDALIPHIKLYAFPESEAFMETLEGKLILNAHPTPFEKNSEMLKIPEDAVCLTFQRVADGQEAPDSPNPLRPGHENLNKDAVFARYVTREDPNFGEGVNLVFAITFDEELVYWIHMGSNFHETVEVNRIVYAMGY